MDTNIEVVVTPALLPLYNVENKIVVVIDILRATTSICVAFKTGVSKILPVATPDEAKLFKDFDFVIAAERNAVKLDGFDMGNSPFEFENPLLKDKSIALTTTNGTKAIKMAKEMGAAQILIGAFVNIDAVANYIQSSKQSVILLCAGWKDKFNIEDTLYAGALVERLQNHCNIDCDSAQAALTLFESVKDHLYDYVCLSSHARRFKLLHTNTDDIEFCLQFNTMDLVPKLQGEYLV